MGEWKYYNHAIIPTTPPHVAPATSKIDSLLKKEKRAFLARWTADFDCGYETQWWYVIKDCPFDISALKAKRRYEINKGIKNFEVKVIDPAHYVEELYQVLIAAYSAYPEKYRPSVDMQEFLASMEQWEGHTCFGAFHRETDELCGYVVLSNPIDGYVDFKMLRAKPSQEKNGINAALVEGILKHFHAFLTDGGYICDGARSVNHETSFQDYLEKYFGFRKAYCRLRITYSPRIKWIVKLAYPFRKILLKLDGIGIVHSFNSVLKMEEICRGQEK